MSQAFNENKAQVSAGSAGNSNASWTPDHASVPPLARIMRWLSVSANEIQNGLAIPRAVKLLNWPYDYAQAVRMGYRILGIMDDHLSGREWLALEHATVADQACYPYVMLAAEGGIDTSGHGAVQAWLKRVESLPGFWPMPRLPGLPTVPLVSPPARS